MVKVAEQHLHQLVIRCKYLGTTKFFVQANLCGCLMTHESVLSKHAMTRTNYNLQTTGVTGCRSVLHFCVYVLWRVAICAVFCGR